MKLFMSCIVLTCCIAQAHALGELADVRLVSRDTGAVLAAYYYRGEYWVAGNPGERYAIEIRNRLGERLLAVTSVDGINVVSGETAGWGQTGYVFGAGEDYRITGWRKSDAEVAAFSFTAAPNSYADRTGRPQNVGVIGVALFLERRVTQEPLVPQAERRAFDGTNRPETRFALPQAKSLGSPMASIPPPAAAEIPSAASPAPSVGAPSLGTAHGPREVSYVRHTEFERKQVQPNEVIHIRYDSMENLVAMGVVQRQRPSRPNAFPETPPYRYVPDPPG